MKCLLHFLISAYILRCTYSERLRQIRLRGFQSMTGVGWAGGGACLPAALMAVRHVNERPGLLDGYNVTYSWADSKCNAGAAMFQLFKTLSATPPVNMILGCACSVASAPTAEVSHLFNLTQLSYASTSPALSDRSRFPNFYQMEMPDHASNPVKIALLNEFNWTRVATINEALESYHTPVIDDFVARVMESGNITIITQEIFHGDPIRRLENLKKHGVRIIIVQMYEDKARKMICSSYKLGLYGRNYVWIFGAHGISEGFWKPRNDVSCTEDEMREAVEGWFHIEPYSRNPRSERGISGLTVSEFDELYRQEETYNPVHDTFYWCAPFSYDHIWIAALALNCTEIYMRSINHSKYLDDFTYADSDINDIILSCMNNLSLVGVSGRIFYGGNAAPVNKDIQIQRIQGSKRITVGTYIMSEERFVWIKDALKWEANKVPRDAYVVKLEEITIPLWLYVTMSSCAAIGVLLSFGFFAFHMIYRYCKKASPPTENITNIWLIGCILVYSTVSMTTSINPTSIICKAKQFCFTIGFTVAIGSFYFEIWRVYDTFFIDKKGQEYFLSRKFRRWRTRARVQPVQRTVMKSELQTDSREISDNHVIGRVLILCTIIVVLLIIWETISPQFLLKKELTNEIYTTDDDTEVRPYVRVCNSKYNQYFSWTIYIIEGLILVFGAFLAWETRNVQQGIHNITRQVGMCLYNTMVLSLFGLVVSLLLEDNMVTVYGLTSGCIILGTTVNLILVLSSKICFIHHGQTTNQPITDGGSTRATIATNQPTTDGGSTLAPIEESGSITSST